MEEEKSYKLRMKAHSEICREIHEQGNVAEWDEKTIALFEFNDVEYPHFAVEILMPNGNFEQLFEIPLQFIGVPYKLPIVLRLVKRGHPEASE